MCDVGAVDSNLTGIQKYKGLKAFESTLHQHVALHVSPAKEFRVFVSQEHDDNKICPVEGL